MSASHGPNPKVMSVVVAIIFIAVATEFFNIGTFNLDITGKQKLESLQTGYKVVNVVDGDTIDVEKNGETTRVRLLGINTPESVDPRRTVECFGQEASDYTKEELTNSNVSLETDPSQSLYDKYGRILAYVYESDGQMINRKLIANGYAYEYTYDNPYKYQAEFKSLQSLAKNEKRGLWSPENCNF